MFQRLFLRVIDGIIANHYIHSFEILILEPNIQYLILHPEKYIQNEKFRSKLRIHYNLSEFPENVNMDFIKNSFLYMAIYCSAPLEIIKSLIEIGCPILNESLKAGLHVISK